MATYNRGTDVHAPKLPVLTACRTLWLVIRRLARSRERRWRGLDELSVKRGTTDSPPPLAGPGRWAGCVRWLGEEGNPARNRAPASANDRGGVRRLHGRSTPLHRDHSASRPLASRIGAQVLHKRQQPIPTNTTLSLSILNREEKTRDARTAEPCELNTPWARVVPFRCARAARS